MSLNESSIESFNHTQLPAFLSVEIGAILKKSRLLKKLSLEDAAEFAKIELQTLIFFENGNGITPLEASYLSYRYGVLVDQIEPLLFGWALLSAKRATDKTRRNHLSVVGINSKPWESENTTIEEVIKYSKEFLLRNKLNL